MSKKPRIVQSVTPYFAETRNYTSVARAEAAFFRALIANKDNLRDNHSVRQALNDVTYFLREPEGRQLDVLVEFYVHDPRSEESQSLYLGTKLSPPGNNIEPQVTHFLCLGDSNNYLTKIHYDRDFNPQAIEKKPSSHIQIGGRIGGSLASKINGSCCWRENLDKPRIPAIPICTALLWHWAFLEYRNAQQITPIFEAPWWDKIVKEAEFTVLKPFFDDGLKLMNNKPQERFFSAFYESVPR